MNGVLPSCPEPAVASMEEEARLRRFQGEPIPAPAHGHEELKQIVLKACTYDPKDRYQSAEEMRRLGLPSSFWSGQLRESEYDVRRPRHHHCGQPDPKHCKGFRLSKSF